MSDILSLMEADPITKASLWATTLGGTLMPKGGKGGGAGGYFDPITGDPLSKQAGGVKGPVRNLGKEVATILGVQEDILPRQLGIERTAQTGQAQVLADVYRDIIGPLSRQETATARAADIEQFGVLAPKAAQSILAADPEQAALRSEMNRQLLEELKAGGQLTPLERQRLQQGVRGAQTARGMGYGQNDAAAEGLAEYLGGSQLQAQRQARAGAQMGLNQQTLGDLFLAVTGRPSQALPYAQGAYGQAAGRAPNTDPFGNQYGQDLFNTNFNAYYQNKWQQQQANIAREQATMQLVGSIIGGVSGGAGAFLGCWLAREVFGAHDIRWRLFRHWLTHCGPRWLHRLYLRYGEWAAAFVHGKPRLRAIIRHWMEGRIASLRWLEPRSALELRIEVTILN
ncbi:MAG: hypothetical protein HW378_173 [Anaerolineales bacterium]|nr:hypothetical protein [Anaerolineales bacterium]